mmetsp:Transcript_63770/g.138705  ORF Transcript_63770/g.138705 Transcript_63770/m.138705 type:complete len:88 (+) Transcript_63770:567-830(+)
MSESTIAPSPPRQELTSLHSRRRVKTTACHTHRTSRESDFARGGGVGLVGITVSQTPVVLSPPRENITAVCERHAVGMAAADTDHTL